LNANLALAGEREILMKFADLGLSDGVLRAVADAGYETPTPIQEQAIPIVLQGRDVLGCAQTGTGKTAAFTLPMIDILSSGRARARMPRSLILEPTRELAMQVGESFEVYGKDSKLSKALLIGGVSFDEQERLIDRGVDVLVATPGRLLDHTERGKVLLNDIKILVIDEADRMLDMGFIPDVERIVSLIPRMRQTLFFSATMAPEIRRLADAFLMNPKEISVAPPASPAEMVNQSLIWTDQESKRDLLRALIAHEDIRNALIFSNRKRDVAMLHRALLRHGLDAAALHGDMAQDQRIETLDRFKRNEVKLLVCSDVAARGLDIQYLSHVFNFDVPHNAEDYIHRIGRTGRAGRSGHAVTIATPADAKAVAAIERLLKRKIPVMTLPDFQSSKPAAAQADEPRRTRGPRRGRDERPARHPARTETAPEPSSLHAAPSSAPSEEQPAAEQPIAELAAAGLAAEPGVATVAPSEPHQSPRASVVSAPAQPRRDRGRPRRHESDDEPDRRVVGMGDHVPAFLLRSIKLSSR
jgi:superfamily II DNA/RNA helicase